MAGELIGIDIEGLEEVQEKLKRLDGPAPKREVNTEVAKFLRAELQKYPPPKRVSRKSAYGQTFFSDRQRKYFFWALKHGRIKVPYTRTQTLRRGWQIESFGQTDKLVINETPYGPYVQQQATQSRMARKIGWKALEEIIKRQSDKIRHIANMVLDKYIRKIGL